MQTDTSEADSAPSNEATVTTSAWPAAPTNLTTTVVSNTRIDLSWTDHATDASSYEVDRSADGVAWTVLTASLPVGAQSYSDTGLADGTLYEYRVRAVNGIGGSGYATGAAATLPTAPTNLQVTVVSGTEMDLSWDTSAYATGYTISMRSEGSTDWSVIATVPATQTTYAATGLMAGGTYYAFCVVPTNSSAESAVAYVDPPTLNTPPVITSVEADPAEVTDTTTTLTVFAGDDDVERHLTYTWDVASSPTDGAVRFSANNTNAAKVTQVTFYKAGNYQFRVTVRDAQGSLAKEFVNVTVDQTQNGVTVDPTDSGVLMGQVRHFTATAIDQFGDDMQTQPSSFTWSLGLGGVGEIDTTGVYTAPESGDDASFTISASSGGFAGSANIAVDKDYNSGTGEGLYQVQRGSIKFHDGDHGATEVVTSSLDVSNADWLEATSPWDAVTQAVTGTLKISGLLWARGSSYQFPDDLTPNPSQPWVKFRYAGAEWNAANNSFTVTLQFTDDDASAPNDFLGTYCTIVVKKLVRPRLLGLTVADIYDANMLGTKPLVNSETAIDDTVKEMYVPEQFVPGQYKPSHTAVIDISTLSAPGNNNKNVHIHVTRLEDDQVIFDGNRTSLDNLTLSFDDDQARDFIVQAWIDTNGNGRADELEVDVTVVTPWLAQGPWTLGKESFVKANADGASLDLLAQDITGDYVDAKALGDFPWVTKDELIDISPLLTILDQRVRAQTVNAALTYKQDTAEFGKLSWNDTHGMNIYSLWNMKEAQVNIIYEAASITPRPRYHCWGMGTVNMARGLIQGALKPGEFDELNLHPWDFGMLGQYRTPNGLDLPRDLVPDGYLMNFQNNDDYGKYHDAGDMFGNEWSIKTGADAFVGWGLDGLYPFYDTPRTNEETIQELVGGFNKGLLDPRLWISAKDVVGYIGTSWFIDIPKVARVIFNLRTGQ
jgi:hypothetical protein